MKKLLIYLFFTLISIHNNAQTFSKRVYVGDVYEITDHGRSILRDMKFYEDKVFIFVDQLCDPDTLDNTRIFCSGVYTFSKDGNLENSFLLDSLFPGGFNKLELVNNQIYVLGQKHGTQNSSNNELSVLDLSLTLEQRKSYSASNMQIIESEGVIYDNQHFYLYGQNSRLNNGSYSYIQKLDQNLEIIDEFNLSSGSNYNSCYSLQPTRNNSLVFINEYLDSAGASGESGQQIKIIDQNGQGTDSINFNDKELYVGVHKALLASSSGDIYFVSEKNPEGQILQSHGRINKYDSNLDTLKWSYELPFNNFINARRYTALRMIEAKNGDIITCGTVFDEGIDGPISNGFDHTYNGFISRITPNGNIVWHRLFKVVNDDSTIPIKEFGRFLNSTIWNLHELDDGRIITGGTAYHNNVQNSVITPAGKPNFYAWLMTINPDGCLDGEECDEVIILDNEYRPKDGFLPFIDDQKTWIGFNSTAGDTVVSFQYTYSSDSISQITNYYHERIQSFQKNGEDSFIEGYYREIEGKIFQKFEGNFNESVIFDISLLLGDTITVRESLLEVVNVDSVFYLDNVMRKRIELKCKNEPQNQESIFWIEGLGELAKLQVCENSNETSQKINCILNKEGNRIYSDIEENEACWFSTSTEEIERLSFQVYPNPVYSVLSINSEINIDFVEILMPDGRILQRYNGAQIDVSNLKSGIYYIKIYSDKAYGIKPFVKI